MCVHLVLWFVLFLEDITFSITVRVLYYFSITVPVHMVYTQCYYSYYSRELSLFSTKVGVRHVCTTCSMFHTFQENLTFSITLGVHRVCTPCAINRTIPGRYHSYHSECTPCVCTLCYYSYYPREISLLVSQWVYTICVHSVPWLELSQKDITPSITMAVHHVCTPCAMIYTMPERYHSYYHRGCTSCVYTQCCDSYYPREILLLVSKWVYTMCVHPLL